MSFIDLEKRVAEIKSIPFNNVCVWYKILNNPNSSTKYHTHNQHQLYPCLFNCDGLNNSKDCYKTITPKESRYILGDMIGDDAI